MLILGIDTSGASGGVTLAEGDETSFRVLAYSPIAGGTFSAQLVPTIATLFQQQKRSLRDIGGFAVASGPGSFTGLRVGLSAVKGLAEILGKPIATVSLLEALEALAVASGKQGRIAAVLDAGRAEVFFGLYEVSASGAVVSRERLLSRSQYLEMASNESLDVIVTSDPSLAEPSDGSKIPILKVDRPGSELIARIGLSKLLAGETVSVEALDANYMRRSDAELFFKGVR